MEKTREFMKVFLIVFAYSSAPFLIMSVFPIFNSVPVLYNLGCIGLIGVFSIITANNNQKSIVRLQLINYANFIHNLRRQLHNLGYQPFITHESEMKFMHPFKFSYYNSDITVRLASDSVIIIGPKKAIHYLTIALK